MQRLILRGSAWLVLLALVLTFAGCSSKIAHTGTNPALAYGYDIFTPNYVNSLEAIYWWRAFPITLAYTNDLTYGGESSRTHFKAAFEEWMTRTNNTINYTWVADPARANVQITFSHLPAEPTNGQELGDCVSQYYVNNLEMSSAVITIVLWDGMTSSEYANVVATATHEMGHALGIHGHSPVQGDIMYPGYDPHFPLLMSSRDVNTIKSLYPQLFVRERKGMPPPPPPTGPLRTVVMH